MCKHSATRIQYGHTSLMYNLLAVCLAALSSQSSAFLLTDQPLRVASFNIRHFGRGLMSNDTVGAYIGRIVSRYDLVFVMETRDKTGTALEKLKNILGPSWTYKASIPIGRSLTYKEQYVYFYKPDKAHLTDARVYADTHDVFEREPYVAQFRYWSLQAGSEVKVTFVGAHLDPDDVPAEMGNLTHVISWAEREFPDSDGVLTMGDLNADCNYMNTAERQSTPLLSTPGRYTSYINDFADTTVSHRTSCAYDRLVLTSQGQGRVTPTNVKIFDFEAGLGLSFYDAYHISDHYPVEFLLQ